MQIGRKNGRITASLIHVGGTQVAGFMQQEDRIVALAWLLFRKRIVPIVLRNRVN